MSVDPDKLYIVHSKPKHDSHSDAIRQFEGDYECLSNTYKCPVSLRGDPEPYPSVEHALQASKTDDLELKGTIRRAKNAIEAKKIARVVKPAPEWRGSSEKIVEALVRDKFRRNAKAREVLVGTGRVRLVYTNTHEDRVWGVCGGKGDNKLGKLLERVRADALAGKDTEVWCAMRFELPLPLDVMVEMAVSKEGKIVAEPSFEGKSVIRMGKLPENEVLMAHPSVSRSHALLVVDKTLGAFLIDLGASNGSFVDGRRLTPYVPEPIAACGAGLTFAKSKRTYTLTRVETSLREAKKGELYARMADPMASVAQPDPDSTIYVGNLEPSVTEDDIREFFAECGDIASVRIPQDKDTGMMRGIAFVAFAKHSGVLHALTLHMDDLKGQSVKIRRADTSKAREKGGGKQQQQQQQQQQQAKQTFSAPPPRLGPRGVPGGGQSSGAGSDPALKNALEVATAAVIKAAEAAKANAVAAAAAGPAPKRQKMSERFGEGSSSAAVATTKRGSRWGDSDPPESGGRRGMPAREEAAAAAEMKGAQGGQSRSGSGRRGGSEADGSGRARDGGVGGRRDDSRGRGGVGGGGGGEGRRRDELDVERAVTGSRSRSSRGQDERRRGRRSESSERTGARERDGRRKGRDDSRGRDRDARESRGGGGGGRRGDRADPERRDDRVGGGSRGDRGGSGDGGGSGRRGGENEGGDRRGGGGSREDGGRHREGGSQRGNGSSRDRRGGREYHGGDRRSRSRSRGRR